MMKELLLFLLIASLLLSFTCSKKTYNYYYPQERGALAGVVSPPNSSARVSAWQGIEIASTYIDTATGYFKISELPVGTYWIKVEAEGYATYESKPVYVVYSGGTTSVGGITLSLLPGLISSTYPRNGATDVPLNAPIEISFSKNMDTASVENAFSINPDIGGKFGWTPRIIFTDTIINFGILDSVVIAEPAPQKAGSTLKRTLRFIPFSSLRGNTTYTVMLDTTAHDTSGTRLEEPFFFSFTTQETKVTGFSPSNGSSNVRTSTSIFVLFNSPMDAQSVEDAFSVTPPVEGEFGWNSNSSSFYFKPENLYLAANTRYAVKIDTTAKDTTGSRLSDSLVFSFTTEGIKVEYIYPPDRSWEISTSADIRVRFNTLMDQASVVSAFSISPSVEGEFSWSGLDQLVFVPNDVLASNSNYVVSIDSTAQDLYGSKAGEVFTAEFNTSPIRILYTSPENGATYVERGSIVQIGFNTSMDQLATVNAFRMIDSDSNLVGGSFTWQGLNYLYFYPDTILENNKEYVVTVSDQAKDIHGITMPQPFRLWFETKP
jgi:hypothetical protein